MKVMINSTFRILITTGARQGDQISGEGSMCSCNKKGNSVLFQLGFSLQLLYYYALQLTFTYTFLLVGNIMSFYKRRNIEKSLFIILVGKSTLKSDPNLNPETTTHFLHYLGKITLSSNLIFLIHSIGIVKPHWVVVRINAEYDSMNIYEFSKQ